MKHRYKLRYSSSHLPFSQTRYEFRWDSLFKYCSFSLWPTNMCHVCIIPSSIISIGLYIQINAILPHNHMTIWCCWRLLILVALEIAINSSSADGGPRSRVCARKTRERGSTSTLAEFFRTCLGGYNCLKVFLIHFLAKSDNSKHFSCFSKKILGG